MKRGCTCTKIETAERKIEALQGRCSYIESRGARPKRSNQKVSESFIRLHGYHRRGTKFKKPLRAESGTSTDLECSTVRPETTTLPENIENFFRVSGACIVVACGIAPECSLTFRAIYSAHSPPFCRPKLRYFSTSS